MNPDEGTSSGSSTGDKRLVEEPAEESLLLYNIDNSLFFDTVEILHTTPSESTLHAPLPMRIRHAEDKVKNNESEVLTLTGVLVNDNASNKVVNVGGTNTVVVNNQVTSINTVGGDLVPIEDSAVPVSVKRGRGRPKKLLSSQSQSGDPPLVIRRREMPAGSCKKHKEAETLHCPPTHDISNSCKEQGGAGATTSCTRGDISGFGKEQKAAATIPYTLSSDISGSARSEFLLNFITVRTKEDILGKLLSFSRIKKRAVCVLSANGTISNVALQQSSSSGGTVIYQGCFKILSLSGSFLPSESGGQHSSTGGLSVVLAGPEGRVLGGSVAGLLTAASSVQISVGTFLAAGQHVTSGCNEVHTSLPKHISLVGGSPTSVSTLSESSGGSRSLSILCTRESNNINRQTGPDISFM